MKATWSVIPLLALAAGCVELNPFHKEPAVVPPVPAVKPAKPVPVHPEQITEKNAREKADALKQELDFEEQ